MARLSTAPTHYDDQLLSLLWLETVVPVGPFGIAVRFKLARMTDESIDCDIPKGVVAPIDQTVEHSDDLAKTHPQILLTRRKN